MGGRIDCYIDIASFYSYVAFADLLPNLGKLSDHGIEVEFHPVLIAGINNLSGNKPPWLLPARSRYLNRDSQRAARRVSKPNLQFPKENFMSRAMTLSPLRALHFIKANYPTATFISAFHCLFDAFWTPPNADLTDAATLAKTLAAATETPEGGRKLFTEDDVKRIMEARDSMKEAVKKETEKVVALGAFGAPWLWVTNAQGQSEAFFGSDRFNHVYEHLGIPFTDVAILASAKL